MKDVIRNQTPVGAALARVSETDPNDAALKDLIAVIAKQPVRSGNTREMTSLSVHSKTEDRRQILLSYVTLSGANRPPPASDSYGGGGFMVDLTEPAASVVNLTSASEATVPSKRKRKRHYKTRVAICVLSKV